MNAHGLVALGRRARAAWRALGSWPRLAALFLAGAAGALAHAPFFFQPAFIAGLVVLVWALDDARRAKRPLRAGFARAWAFGAGLFLAGIWWVANAFLVNDGEYLWLIWAPLLLFPAGLALFWGAAGGLYAAVAPRGPARIAVFAVIVLAVELIRSVVLSGFPWNLPGHVFQAGGSISQIASVIGASGLSAFVLYAFAAPAALAGPGARIARAAPSVLGLALLGGFWIWGALRLDAAQAEPAGVTVRVAQLDWPQSALRPENVAAVLDEYLTVSTQSSLEEIAAVIWPEGSVPAWLMNEPELLQRIAERLPEGVLLIAGAPHVAFGEGDAPDRYFNSLHALRVEAGAVTVEARYDKARLVPFGEANTLAALTRPFGLETLSQYAIGFDAGQGARSLDLDGLPPVAPLICYEVIYPRWVPRGGERPAWLLNISNDAWYGDTAGPAQLLNQAAYRSIEEGLPTVRAASAGASGLIDGYGRPLFLSRVEYSQAIDLPLLKGLDESVYAEYGNRVWVIAFALLIALTAWISPSSGSRLHRNG